MMLLENDEDIEDFVRGCTFFGTGGGGAYEDGVAMLKARSGKKLGWIDAENLRDGEYTACPFLMGSIAPVRDETQLEMKKYGLREEKYTYDQCLIQALKTTEEYTHRQIKALVPAEIGGVNTPVCMAAAIDLNLPVIDGDYSGGRAIPEMRQGTLNIYGKSFLPVISMDRWGNTSVIKESVSEAMTERIGKYLSVASFGMMGNVAYVMNGRDTKESVVRGTLTESLNVGRRIRLARENGEDPVKAVADYLDGYVLQRGVVTSRQCEDKEGYYTGYTTISSLESCCEARIWFKNENHICIINDILIVSSPDKIIVVDSDTAEPLTNTLLKEGDRVAVICVKACAAYRTKKGIELMEPKAFGFDYEYVPVEKALEASL